jgi:hypothetical protein
MCESKHGSGAQSQSTESTKTKTKNTAYSRVPGEGGSYWLIKYTPQRITFCAGNTKSSDPSSTSIHLTDTSLLCVCDQGALAGAVGR